MAQHLVDIIVTTRNNASVLRETLRSIAAQTFSDYRCSVIDDASTDDTLAMIRREFPWVHAFPVNTASGPSRNRNVAAESGGGPFIVTLDDDVVLTSNWLREMVDFISRSPAIGAVGCQLRLLESPDLLNTVGGLICADGIGGDIFFGVPVADVQGLIDQPLRIIYACSAAMMMRRSAFEEAGRFDPAYFYLAEDFDLGLRLNLRGHCVVYNPHAVAYHRYHTTARQLRPAHVDYLYWRNSFLTILKNFRLPTILRMLQALPNHPHLRRRWLHRLLHGYAILKAVAWLLGHSGRTWRARQDIQNSRVVPEDELFSVNARLLALRSRSAGAAAPPSPPESASLRWLRSAARVVRSWRAAKRGNAPLEPERKYVDNIIFQITNICNAACKQCFVLDQLNHDVHKNLSLQEVERFFGSIGRVRNIVLGGGEPFLRKDLDRLCATLARVSKPDGITIPTNGAYPEIIFRQIKAVLETTRVALKISLSIDGPPETHDAIRKVSGLFDQVKDTYTRLAWLYHVFYPRLILQVNSTVFRDNYDQFTETYRLAKEHFPLAQFTFETIRGHYDKGVEPITDAEYARLLRAVRDTGDTSMTHTLTLHELALETLKRRTQVIPCNGGANFIVLDFFGNLYPCEVLPSFVNIRDIDYDFARVVENPGWKQVIEDIQNAKCHCTHMCFLSSSLEEAQQGGRLPIAGRWGEPVGIHSQE